MAKEEKKQDKKPTRTPEEIEAEKAAKVAKKAEMAAKAKVAGTASAHRRSQGRRSQSRRQTEARGGKGAKGGKGGGSGRRRDEGGEAIPFPKDYVPRLKKRFETDIAPALMAELNLKNTRALPRVEKVVISMGLGKAIAETPRLEAAVKELSQIAGQTAVV